MQLDINDAIRAFVDGPFVAAYPTVPIVYENAGFDWNNPPPLFVTLEVLFQDGRQIGMAYAPKTRLHGCVYLSVYARQGSGSRASLGLLDWFASLLGYQQIGAAQLQAPSPNGTSEHKDWFCQELKFDFHASET